MRIFSVYLLTVILVFTSCGSNDKKSKEHKQAKGGIKYGGTFRYNETEYLKSLYPLGITETVSHHIVTQIYEGLVHFNTKDLTIEPLLADSWTISPDAKTYTFKLHPGVAFHDDTCFKGGKGRLVTAKDFEYCLNVLCTPDSKNNGFSFFRGIVKGATEHYEAIQNGKPLSGGLEGITVLNDSTLQIELEKPYADFMERLALPFTAVFPKEAVDYYKGNILYHTVGTGPYMMKALKQDEAVILVRNDNPPRAPNGWHRV